MTKYRTLKDIAKDVRSSLKAAMPEYKFSVTTEVYSGGGSIHVALMSGPVPVVEGWAPGSNGKEWGHPVPDYAQLNHYQLLRDDEQHPRLTNGVILTEQGWTVMQFATQTLAAHHWDESDAQVDYFHCNFYMHVNIGKWDKPYTVKA